MVRELFVFLVAMTACVRALAVPGNCLYGLSLSFSVAPTAPPVGSYDIGGQDSKAGAVSFHKAARFKSDGSGTNTHRLPQLPAIMYSINYICCFLFHRLW